MYNEHRTVAHTGVRWHGRRTATCKHSQCGNLWKTNCTILAAPSQWEFLGSSTNIFSTSMHFLICILIRPVSPIPRTSLYNALPTYLFNYGPIKCKSITVRESRGTSSTKLEVHALNQFVIWGPVHILLNLRIWDTSYLGTHLCFILKYTSLGVCHTSLLVMCELNFFEVRHSLVFPLCSYIVHRGVSIASIIYSVVQ